MSDIFTRFISATLLSEDLADLSSPIAGEASPPATYQEVLDFLISRPTSHQISGFKVSDQSQIRLQSLLQKNRETSLSPTAKSELDLYEQLDNLMNLLKVRAFSALQPSSEV